MLNLFFPLEELKMFPFGGSPDAAQLHHFLPENSEAFAGTLSAIPYVYTINEP